VQTPTALDPKWIVRPKAREQAETRLFCLPYSGGGAAAFHRWAALLPEAVELNLVQLPGRETRLREEPLTRMETLINALVPMVAGLLDRPYALFGHSMGALSAFELARGLRRKGAPAPLCLFVSGRRAPQLADPEPPLHTLADGPFVAAVVRRYNAIPRIILDDIELLRLFLPTLRADFELLETYTYRTEPPLACPIVALGGNDDARASAQELAAWQMHTQSWFQMRRFPGDHFYLQSERDALIRLLVDVLHAERQN
jgi:medium-chain acyl-[acyl-carrier-protein] hydrolase